MADEYTVESALKELRAWFPLKVRGNKLGRGIDVSHREFMCSSARGDRFESKANIRVEYASGGYSAPLVIEAPTLDDAMAQVKKWRESQS